MRSVAHESDGYHARTNKVELGVGICMHCEEEKPVLCFDNSDEEYQTMCFCKDCLNEFFHDN